MARVFVSYASRDRPTATIVEERLRADGHDVFLDHDVVAGIRVGEEWKRRLHSELRRADAVVALVSTASLTSSWCLAEIGIADALGCRIVPIALEQGLTHPFLGSLQFADYAADPERALALVLQRLRTLLPADTSFGADENPFPGLVPFTPGRAIVFHGRSADVLELSNRLRRPGRDDGSVLAIVGPSGCGKSSVLGAGLVDRFERDDGWLSLPIWVPGNDPVGSIARSLTVAATTRGLGWSVRSVRDRLAEGPRALPNMIDDLLDADLHTGRDRVLMAVDQAEELFTRAGPDAREDAWKLLREGLSGPLHVVATLRSEFLDDLIELPSLAGVPIDSYVLAPLPPSMLPVVVEEPARVAGLTLEPELTPRLVADTGSGEALPLLAFTLRKLAEGVPRGGTLTAARYEALGGVGGALAQHADASLAVAVARSGLTQDEVLAGLVRLVTIDDAGRRARRRVRLARLPAPLQVAMGVLVDDRLLVTVAEDDEARVTVAHEALLTAWKPLDAAVSGLAAALVAGRRVEQAAEEWRSGGSPDYDLWSGERLIAAQTILRGGGTALELDDDGQAFLDASQALDATLKRRDRRRRRALVASLSVLLVAAIGVAAVFLGLLQSTRTAQRDAVARDLLGRSSTAATTDAWLGTRLAIASERLQPSRAAENALVRSLSIGTFTAAIGPLGSPVLAATFAPNGRTLAIGDGSGRITFQDVTDREHPVQVDTDLVGHGSAVTGLAFAPRGGLFASIGADGSLVLWSVADPARPQRLGSGLPYPLRLRSVAFSPDGHLVVTAADDGTAQLWDVADPADPAMIGAPMVHPGGPMSSAVFTDGGRIVVTAGSDGQLLLWDVADARNPQRVGPPLTGHSELVSSVAADPDPTRPGVIASGGYDGTAILWDVSDPTKPARLGTVAVGQGSIAAVAFAIGQGRATLATASTDRSVVLSDITDPTQPVRYSDTFPGHSTAITALAVAPGGQTMATGGLDTSVLLWSLGGQRSSQIIAEGPNRTQVAAGSLSWIGTTPQGSATYTTDGAGILHAMPIPALGAPAAVDTGQGAGRAGAFARDRPLFASGGTDGTTRLWDVTDPGGPVAIGPVLGGHDGPVLAASFTPDGRLLAVAGMDRTVIFWDTSDPSRPVKVGAPLEAAISRPGVTAVAFLADPTVMMTAADDGVVTLWDVGDPVHPQSLARVPDAHRASVRTVAFSPDGQTMATGGDDYQVVLWSIGTRGELTPIGRPLVDHRNAVIALAFTPDGQSLLTAGSDSFVLLWDVSDRARPEKVGSILQTGQVRPVGMAITPRNWLVVAFTDGSLVTGRLADLADLRTHAMDVACGRTAGGLTAEQWPIYAPGLDYEDTCG